MREMDKNITIKLDGSLTGWRWLDIPFGVLLGVLAFPLEVTVFVMLVSDRFDPDKLNTWYSLSAILALQTFVFWLLAKKVRYVGLPGLVVSGLWMILFFYLYFSGYHFGFIDATYLKHAE